MPQLQEGRGAYNKGSAVGKQTLDVPDSRDLKVGLHEYCIPFRAEAYSNIFTRIGSQAPLSILSLPNSYDGPETSFVGQKEA